MSWTCNKHEVDRGSLGWEQELVKYDNDCCPFCYHDLEEDNKKLVEALEQIKAGSNIFLLDGSLLGYHEIENIAEQALPNEVSDES